MVTTVSLKSLYSNCFRILYRITCQILQSQYDKTNKRSNDNQITYFKTPFQVTLSQGAGNGPTDVNGQAWDIFEFDADILTYKVKLTAKSVYTHGNNGLAEIEFYGQKISKFTPYALISSHFLVFQTGSLLPVECCSSFAS